jgi:multidrug efflux pump subunit AcrA (membrane-fusion protein)
MRLIDVGQRLGLDALRGVDHQQRAFAGGQRAADLIGEVDVAGRVHQVEDIGLAVLGLVVEAHGLRLDGDAALALDIHRCRAPAPSSRGRSRPPVIWISRSASVDLPWSIWATMEKLRIQASIRAPVSGLVISRSVTRGQIVQPGTELFRIVRDGRLELDAQIPETEIRLVRAGQSAVVSSDDIGSASGSVRIVTPEVDAQTRLGVARISLASGSGLRAGMFARAEIDVGAQEAVVVPTASILYRENRSGVFVLVEGGVARFQEVSVQSRTDAFSAVDGIPAGAQVIVEGAGFLGDGDRVAVTPAQ